MLSKTSQIHKDKYCMISLYEESRVVKLIETERWLLGARGGVNGEVLVEGFSNTRWISPRDLLYDIVPMVNNAVYGTLSNLRA